jgi:hypothetical protein
MPVNMPCLCVLAIPGFICRVAALYNLPLQIVLSLSTRPAPSSSASQQQQATLQQIIPSKDRETVQRYIAAMADPATFDELRQLADSGEASAETLNAAFTRIVISSAIGAGYMIQDGCSA